MGDDASWLLDRMPYATVEQIDAFTEKVAVL
jgi:hypothetical protein